MEGANESLIARCLSAQFQLAWRTQRDWVEGQEVLLHYNDNSEFRDSKPCESSITCRCCSPVSIKTGRFQNLVRSDRQRRFLHRRPSSLRFELKTVARSRQRNRDDA